MNYDIDFRKLFSELWALETEICRNSHEAQKFVKTGLFQKSHEYNLLVIKFFASYRAAKESMETFRFVRLFGRTWPVHALYLEVQMTAELPSVGTAPGSGRQRLWAAVYNAVRSYGKVYIHVSM